MAENDDDKLPDESAEPDLNEELHLPEVVSSASSARTARFLAAGYWREICESALAIKFQAEMAGDLMAFILLGKEIISDPWFKQRMLRTQTIFARSAEEVAGEISYAEKVALRNRLKGKGALRNVFPEDKRP